MPCQRDATHGWWVQSCRSNVDSVVPVVANVHDVAEMRLDMLVMGLCQAIGIESGSSHFTHAPRAHFMSGHLYVSKQMQTWWMY